MRRLIPDPFILALLATVAFASLLPVRGVAAGAADMLATAAIILLFFFHGARLSRRSVLAGLTNWRLHLLILGTTFVIFPLLGMGFVALAGDLVVPPLLIGLLYLSVLPSTVQSSIAFTAMAGGNVPAAIAAASASQLLGVFLTPLLVGLLMRQQGGDVALSGMGTVVLIVLLPFVVGHMCRPWVGEWIGRHRKLVGLNDKAAILMAVYVAFSEAVVNGVWQQLPMADLAILFGICIALLALILPITLLLGRLLGLPRPDRITLLFCGSKKSLVQGVPMGRALFPGPDLGLILLPIMIFHQIQLLACAWIAGRLAREGEAE